MSPPLWVVELAGRFWAAAGPPPPYPRDLTMAATVALQLCVVRLAGLSLDGVRGWLTRAKVPVRIDEPDRPLRGCLVGWASAGVAFVDAADPPAEQRFSLAHEVAHFLRDYAAVRRAAAGRLGPGVLDVLDGRRPATAEERIHAVLRHVPVAAHVHLLGRDDAGRPRSDAESEAEAAADRLANELLAPAELFAGAGDPAAVRGQLETVYGFPPAAAARYARELCPAPSADPLVERLRRIW